MEVASEHHGNTGGSDGLWVRQTEVSCLAEDSEDLQTDTLISLLTRGTEGQHDEEVHNPLNQNTLQDEKEHPDP